MELDSSLPYSQQTATCPYPQLYQSNPRPIVFIEDQF